MGTLSTMLITFRFVQIINMIIIKNNPFINIFDKRSIFNVEIFNSLPLSNIHPTHTITALIERVLYWLSGKEIDLNLMPAYLRYR